MYKTIVHLYEPMPYDRFPDGCPICLKELRGLSCAEKDADRTYVFSCGAEFRIDGQELCLVKAGRECEADELDPEIYKVWNSFGGFA